MNQFSEFYSLTLPTSLLFQSYWKVLKESHIVSKSHLFIYLFIMGFSGIVRGMGKNIKKKSISCMWWGTTVNNFVIVFKQDQTLRSKLIISCLCVIIAPVMIYGCPIKVSKLLCKNVFNVS